MNKSKWAIIGLAVPAVLMVLAKGAAIYGSRRWERDTQEFRMRLEHFTSVQPVVVVQKDHRPHRDRHAFDVRIRFNRLDEISKIGGILDRLWKNELIVRIMDEDRPVAFLNSMVSPKTNKKGGRERERGG